MSAHWEMQEGDVLKRLRKIKSEHFHSFYADVPYGLGPKQPTGPEILAYLRGAQMDTSGDFMARKWSVPSVRVWKETFRVLRPGAPLLVNAAPRTLDLVMLGMRMAGFEIADVILWMFSSAMPKNYNVSSALSECVDRTECLRLVEEWKAFSSRVPCAGAQFQDEPECRGSSTPSGESARAGALRLVSPRSDDACAVIADLSSTGARHMSTEERGCSAVSRAERRSPGLKSHATSVALSSSSGSPTPNTTGSFAPCGASDSLVERVARSPMAVEALRTWLGARRCSETTATDALLVDLTSALKVTIASQSETFRSFDTTRQMACVSATTVTITESTAASLISSTAATLASDLDGYGTALAPGYEPVILAWKPNEGTYVENVAKHGCGALNIDAARIVFASDGDEAETKTKNQHGDFGSERHGSVCYGAINAPRGNYAASGRWPKNLILDGDIGAELDATVGDRPGMSGGGQHRADYGGGMFGGIDSTSTARNDNGGPSRFYKYCPKASREERDLGCEHLPLRRPGETVNREEWTAGIKSGRAGAGRTGEGVRNHGPCVKPLALTRYLAKLVLPPPGTTPRRLLNLYAGTGSEALGAILAGWDEVTCVELDPEFAEIARARLTLATENPRAFEALIDGTLDRGEKVDARQQDLFGGGK